jgi:hypothetical protein
VPSDTATSGDTGVQLPTDTPSGSPTQ